jgi:nickel-dependent lactate racemase
MNELKVKYGSIHLPVNFPERMVRLQHTEPEINVDPESIKEQLLQKLNALGKKPGNVGIIVSDKTRLCEYPLWLPVITGVLQEFGIDRENITLYIAYGTHPLQSEEESQNAYGETYDQYRFIHHRSKEEGALVSLGKTKLGTRVKIRKDILQHDLLISLGAILHHYFAGYGGGRKLLFPGLAGYDAILHNHSLFLDFKKRMLQPGCQSGNLQYNPLAEDLQEINDMLPDRLEIHAILNSRREVCELHFGSHYEDFRKACLSYDLYFRLKEAQQYDLVVATAGGYPKDINFIQGHKSIHNAASFVRDNGRLIIFAECIDGLGNEAFMKLFELGGREAIFKAMEKAYANNAGTALAMLEKAERIKIHFVTSLDREVCRRMGAIKTSPEEAQEIIHRETGEIAFIENASLVYK